MLLESVKWGKAILKKGTISCRLQAVLRTLHLARGFHAAFFFLAAISFGSRSIQGGVLGISSDGDDQRIFLGLRFSIPGFFGYKYLASIFLGSLI